MSSLIRRRTFLKTGLAAGAAVGFGVRAHAAHTPLNPVWGKHKAVITFPPKEETFTELKAAGFNGVEVNLWHPKEGMTTLDEAAKVRELAAKMDMRVHTVLRGWAEFNSPDPDKVKTDKEFTIHTLQAAQAYGADAILLVGGRLDGDKFAMPEPDRWKVKFDPKNGHLLQVADGDNSAYKDYMQAHDHAYDSFIRHISDLIPVAEETGVVVGVENVWNNLFIGPDHFGHMIDAFKSPWVRAYFDCGNQVKYRIPPEQWIRTLGKRIVKLHIKDYKLDVPKEQEWPSLREGSVNWPNVAKALIEIGYDGWFTIEGPCGEGRAECSRRLDLILAGM
ncbi:MAG: TIM barrel protein [Candidatus Omnitrophica bacterium]|nr:TIM barrel protein [Candidatus Omnitrophota bacterium]